MDQTKPQTGFRWSKILICLILMLFVVSVVFLQFGLELPFDKGSDPINPTASGTPAVASTPPVQAAPPLAPPTAPPPVPVPVPAPVPVPVEAPAVIDCDKLDLPKEDFCFKGKIYKLPQTEAIPFHREIFLSLQKPPLEKRTFAPLTPGMKLEVVLIEMKPADQPKLLPTMYNIANIHGGSTTGFTVVYNGFHETKLGPIKAEWPNVRWIKIDGPFTIPDYNRMLTSMAFFDQFQSRFMLLSHTDSMMYRTLDDDLFLYDYVGSPWPIQNQWCGAGRSQVGNGGYCLRNIAAMKETLKTNVWDGATPEDLWWCKVSKNLPSEAVANRFGTEITWFDGIPTGSHQLERMAAPWNNGGHYWRTFCKNNNISLN